jgi:pilus assembly protein CpaB
MKIKKRVLILAVLLGLLTVSVLYFYIRGLDKKPDVETQIKNTVVAVSTIPAHVKITEEMLTIKALPIEAVHPDAFTSIQEVVGGTTKSEIISGEQIIKGRVITDGVSSPLAYRIPENMRAVTVPLNEISGVAGYIEVGDKVDVLVHYEFEVLNAEGNTTQKTQEVFTQFQNLEVMEKGPYPVTAEEKQIGVTTSITLLVTPAQAEVIVFANINGTIHMTLRNPVDTNKVDLQQFGTGNFNTWRDR